MRIRLAAVALAVSAGMHGALAPEHLADMPNTGRLFVGAAVAGISASLWLLTSPQSSQAQATCALLLAGNIAAYVLWITVRVPLVPGTPEPIEAIAVVCKGVEAVGLVALSGQSIARAYHDAVRFLSGGDPSPASGRAPTRVRP
jgi:hypothetical protein